MVGTARLALRRSTSGPSVRSFGRTKAIQYLVPTAMLAAILSACTPAPPPFSVVVLPDTQYYTVTSESGGSGCKRRANEATPDFYQEQMNWINAHEVTDNIDLVIHLGDVTQDQSSVAVTDQWQTAKDAHDALHSTIPQLIVPGNHDNPHKGLGQRNTESFNETFPAPQGDPLCFRDDPGTHSLDLGATPCSSDNSYVLFDEGELHFLVIGLEFVPRKEALSWAEHLIETYPDRRVMIVTHCFLNRNGAHAQECDSAWDKVGADGEDLFEELIRRHSNIFLVLSGHHNGLALKREGSPFGLPLASPAIRAPLQALGLLRDVEGSGSDSLGDAAQGQPAQIQFPYQMLADFQLEYYGSDPAQHCGNSWMSQLVFQPERRCGTINGLPVRGCIELTTFRADGSDEPLKLTDYQLSTDTPVLLPYSMGTSPRSPTIDLHKSAAVGFGDLQVNNDNRGDQTEPAVALGETGVVVVWQDSLGPPPAGASRTRIMGSYLAPDGTTLVNDFFVSDMPRGSQTSPSVSMSTDGRFVVAWVDHDGAADDRIMAALFDSDGSKIGDDIVVNEERSAARLDPSVAMGAAGHFVVVWEEATPSGAGRAPVPIYGASFDPNGQRLGPDFAVGAAGRGSQRRPSVAIDSSGWFVVAWEDDRDTNGPFQIFGAVFDEGAAKQVADFRVNNAVSGNQLRPSVAVRPNGDYVIAWEDDSSEKDSSQIYASGFLAHSDARRFEDILVNQDPVDQQRRPSVGFDSSGRVVVVWQDNRDNNDLWQIRGSTFLWPHDGQEIQRTPDFTVNGDETGEQEHPMVAVHPRSGIYVVTWEDNLQSLGYFPESHGYDILAKARVLPKEGPSARRTYLVLALGIVVLAGLAGWTALRRGKQGKAHP